MTNASLSKKKAIIIVISSIVAAIAVVIATIIIINSQSKPEFEYEGWIDCMPNLSEGQSDLCRRAKEANYPYIAY